MTRPLLFVLAAVLVVGCGSSSSPSSPSSNNITFTAQLSPGNETPPVTNAESSASGTASIVFVPTKDSAGNITSAVGTATVTMQGFPAGSTITLAHIHTGGVGVAGPILVNTSTVPGEVVLVNGAGSFTRNGISMTAATAQSILDNPSGFYFNVHTTLNPGGVMRGQLVKQ